MAALSPRQALRPKTPGKPSSSRSDVQSGKRRALACDVVIDGLALDPDGGYVQPHIVANFLKTLGTQILSVNAQGIAINSTPSKPRRIDLIAVRNALKELAQTEESYLHKMTTLLEQFAVPLRRSASLRQGPISVEEARVLFSNIEQLVPLSQRFHEGLNEMLEELEMDTMYLPTTFGRMILDNVRQMGPFRAYLSGDAASQRLHAELKSRNPAFIEWIKRREMLILDSVGHFLFGLTLAEPFQRVSRYCMMIDPIICHLPSDDENLADLEEARTLLTDICRMEKESKDYQAAVMWGLNEAIEFFPAELLTSDAPFIACLDVDETFESRANSLSTVLQATLFLFSDKVILVKRPSNGAMGKKLAGLDNTDLVALYLASQQTRAPTASTGTPLRKLKKDTLGFRGSFPISEISAFDLGGPSLGLVLLHPPTQESERWNDRPARTYTVVNGYANGEQQKESFLSAFDQTKCAAKREKGWMARKGSTIMEPKGDGSSRVFWSICGRGDWDEDQVDEKGPLVLHVDWSGIAPDLTFDTADPKIIARVNVPHPGNEGVLPSNIDISVRFKDGPSTVLSSRDGLVRGIVTICTTHKLDAFPHPSLTATSPANLHHSHTRGLLNFINSSADALKGNSNNLMRGQSNASATSSASFSTFSTQGTNRSDSSMRFLGGLRRTPAARNGKRGALGSLLGGASKSVTDLGSGRMILDEEMHEEETPEEMDTTLTIGPDTPAELRRRRRSSLPLPPHPSFSTTIPVPSHSNINTIEPLSPSPRRRAMGPRAIGQHPPPISTPTQHAPPPTQIAFSAPPLSRPNPSPSAGTSARKPVPLFQSLERNDSQSSSSKRPLEPSPRPSPAKKVAPLSLAEEPESGRMMNRPRPQPTNGSTRRGGRRIPSGGGGGAGSGTTRVSEEEQETGDVFDDLGPMGRAAPPPPTLVLHGDSPKARSITPFPTPGKENDRFLVGFTPSRSAAGGIGISRSPKTSHLVSSLSASPPPPTPEKSKPATQLVRKSSQMSTRTEDRIKVQFRELQYEKEYMEKELRTEMGRMREENELLKEGLREVQIREEKMTRKRDHWKLAHAELKRGIEGLFESYDEELATMYELFERPDASMEEFKDEYRSIATQRNELQLQLLMAQNERRVPPRRTHEEA